MPETPDRSDDRGTVPEALASSSRSALLGLLRNRPGGLDVRELSHSSGLASTSVRFHLDVLQRAALIEAHPEPRTTPGRRRLIYTTTAAADSEASATAYQQLVAVLAANFGTTRRERATRAEHAGRAWANGQPALSGRARRRGRAATVDAVLGMFRDLGFRPEPAPGAGTGGTRARRLDSSQILLRGCPFRDLARSHPEVVCAAHLGLLRGAITQLGSVTAEATLTPFVEPELCVAELTFASADAGDASR